MIRPLRFLRSTARAIRNGLDLLRLVSVDGYDRARQPVHFESLDAALDAFEAGNLTVGEHNHTSTMPPVIATPWGERLLWHAEVQRLARRRRGAP